MRTPRPATLTVAAALTATFVALPTGVGVAAYRHDQSTLRKLPSHTLISGVDVSGLDRTTAVARVRTVIDRQLDHPATLIVGKHHYTVTPRELGVRDDAEAA